MSNTEIVVTLIEFILSIKNLKEILGKTRNPRILLQSGLHTPFRREFNVKWNKFYLAILFLQKIYLITLL